MFKGLSVLGAAVLLTVGAWSAPTQAASLIGASVGCSLQNNASFACTPSPFTVTEAGGMPDAVVEATSTGTDTLGINFMDRWVDITYLLTGGALSLVNSEVLVLSGLINQTPGGDPFEGISALSISGVSGLDAGDFLFSGNTLSIDLDGTTWEIGATVSFDVGVPLPAPLLMLLTGILGLGFVSARRRTPAPA